MKKQEYIYRVSIKDEPAGNNIWTTDYYFTSLSAIYEQLTPEQIGCKVENLWNLKISTDKPYFGRKCTITKELLTRKRQTKKKL